MPFSGPDDAKLPEHIQKMSAMKRRAFAAAFNSAMEDHRSGESSKDRESRAFATANAAAKRAGEKDMTTEPLAEEAGTKDEHPMPVVVMNDMPPSFAAGAMSFTDYDRYREEEQRQQALAYTFHTFEGLLANVMNAHEMAPSERVAGMRSLVEQLATRLDEVTADPSVAFKADPPAPASTSPVAERELVGAREARQSDDGAVTIFKDKSGRYRWVAIHSNRYMDREKDIFPGEAHTDYVEWANATKQFPPLRLWHAPFDIGPGDGLDYASEGFVVSTGTFYPGMEPVARNLKQMSDEGRLGCSHGFTYKAADYRGGVFHRYRTFEVTALPRESAANLLTDFGVKEALMLSDARRKFFEEALGAEGAKTLETSLATLGQKAREEGVAFKDVFVGIDLDAAAEVTPGTPAAGSKEAPVETTPIAEPVAAAAAVAPVAAPPTEAVPAGEGLPTAADTATHATLPQTPDAAAAALASGDAVKAFKDMIGGAVGEALAPFGARLELLEAGVLNLQKSKDETIASAIRPAVGPTGAVPASLAATSVVDDAAAVAAVREASSKVMDERDPIAKHFKALTHAFPGAGD